MNEENIVAKLKELERRIYKIEYSFKEMQDVWNSFILKGIKAMEKEE